MEDDSTGQSPSTGADQRPWDWTVSQDVLDLDYVYDALGHPRRRYLCYTLLEDSEWTLPELAAKVAAWELDRADGEVSTDERDPVYVSLYHAHVPKLVDLGVIEFEEEDELIVPGPNAEQVLTALQGMGAVADSSQEVHAREERDGEGA